MFNVAEYIAVRRAMHIIQALRCPLNEACVVEGQFESLGQHGTGCVTNICDSYDLSETFQPIDIVEITNRLTDVFTLISPGSQVSKFVGVHTTEEGAINVVPMFLVEIFEPSHAYMPVYMTADHVLAVSPFRAPMLKTFSGSNYLLNLFPIELLSKNRTFVELQKALEEPILSGLELPEDIKEVTPDMTINFRMVISDLIKSYSQSVVSSDKALYLVNHEFPSEIVTPVSAESRELEIIKERFGEDSISGFLAADAVEDSIIKVTDYVPIYVTTDDKSSSGPAVYEKGEDGIVRATFKPRIGGTVSNPNNVTAILTKENLRFGKCYVMQLDQNCYYVGKNLLSNAEGVTEPIYSYVYVEGDEIASSEETFGIGTESARENISNLKKVITTMAKKLGIKVGSQLYEAFKILFKLPKDAVKWIYKTVTDTFKTANELEKAETLELQEKLLNDEMDAMSERLKYYAQIHTRGTVIAAAVGAFWFVPLGWIIARSRTKKAKLKAIDRLEIKLDGAIDRLNKKIAHAEERSDAESEDKLMKELQTYKLAKLKLLDIKKRVYGGSRIKYATFDKDLTLTAGQRISEYLR